MFDVGCRWLMTWTVNWLQLILATALVCQPCWVSTVINLASYPQRDGKWVVAHGLRGEGLVHWLGRWYVCVLHRGSKCSPSRAMDGRTMRYGISSCQSAATSEIVKALLFESTHVNSAIASTQTFTLLPLLIWQALLTRLLMNTSWLYFPRKDRPNIGMAFTHRFYV